MTTRHAVDGSIFCATGGITLVAVCRVVLGSYGSSATPPLYTNGARLSRGARGSGRGPTPGRGTLRSMRRGSSFLLGAALGLSAAVMAVTGLVAHGCGDQDTAGTG